VPLRTISGFGPDLDIARNALRALKAELPISHNRIKVLVKDGWINPRTRMKETAEAYLGSKSRRR
jgi:hypothetical protein